MRSGNTARNNPDFYRPIAVASGSTAFLQGVFGSLNYQVTNLKPRTIIRYVRFRMNQLIRVEG
jgi:hypothetical protein